MPEPSKGGRPRFEITPAVIEKAYSLAKNGCTARQIAASLGMSEPCYYNKCNQYVEFKDAIKKGEAESIVELENLLHKAARAGNITATIFALKCRGKWREIDPPPGNEPPGDKPKEADPFVASLNDKSVEDWAGYKDDSATSTPVSADAVQQETTPAIELVDP